MSLAKTPRVRDFTEETRTRLVTEIENSAAREGMAYRAAMENFFDLFTSSDIEWYVRQLEGMRIDYNRVQRIKVEAIENINEIFSDVREADVEYATRFESILNRLDAYLNTLTRLENLINPSMPGACPIGAPFLFMEQLAGIGNGMMDYWVNQLMQVSEDGSDGIQYNWSMLEEWMQIDPNELSTTQMAALVFVYLSMDDPDDIVRLITAGYRSINRLDNVYYETQHLIFEQTEMLRELTAAVTVAVEPLAMATVWADPPINDPVIDQCVRNMQILHVMSGGAVRIPTRNSTGVPVSGLRSETPIRLYIDDDGVWYIQYAVNTEEEISGVLPTQFALSRGISLGRVGTSMDYLSAAGRHASYNYTNLVTAGSLGASLARESGTAMRDMVIGNVLSSAVSNTTRATAASTGVGVILNVIADYAEAIEQRNAALSYLDEAELYRGIHDLGGRICFTPISGVNVVHGINLQTRDAIVRTEGFLHTHNYEITVEQLHMIILNGDQDTGASAIESLEGIDIDDALQQEIFNRYYRYIYHQEPNQESEHVAYRRALRRTAIAIRGEITNLFGSAYDVDSVVFGEDVEVLDWPVEILAYVIGRRNESA